MADNYTGTEWKTRTQISTELMSKIDEGIMIATNAAENAKNDAETAQKSAEAAQELAESSKEAAEAAQTAATEAQSAAEASASDVEEAKKLAEEAQEAANIASSDAESAKDAAETAQKALESIPSDIENFETTLNEVKSDISKLEDEINTLNSDLIVTDTVSTTQTIEPSSTYNGSISCSKSGYTAIGVAGFGASTGYANVFRVNMGTNTVYVGIRNMDSSNSRDITLEVTVLYRKNA